jgi:hypothetical protein
MTQALYAHMNNKRKKRNKKEKKRKKKKVVAHACSRSTLLDIQLSVMMKRLISVLSNVKPITTCSC